MQEGRTLRPEDHVSHYRIVGPLGAGGMGEVYLAQDQTLERSVALKILPPALTRNEERVRRFVLEAKSASSLNHPNIVTIYEIGQDEVQSSDGATTPTVHFISMELVSGETLSTKIHHEKTDLRTLLGWLAQAADGIAKAHAAGIVHRDLKPGNIMVSRDGYAKVLDFGLAKLTEKRDAGADLTTAPTIAEGTTIGAVMGTVGYMSPEQVAGKPVDARSDIFSFGCILYEATTRQKPFNAETGVETMHKILNERPAPIEELNPEAPAELRRVIRRCLAKVPDQRFQSMKDVAIELREIVEEFDALSASASSGSGATAAGMAPVRGRAKRGVPLLPVAGAVALLGIVLVLWWLRGGHRAGAAGPPPGVRIATQTNLGDVDECAISPDGRYLAYIPQKAGSASVHVRQIATGSDVEVVPWMEAQIFGLTFSGDGDYLYFLGPRRDNPRYRALYQVPSLGGQPLEKAFDVDTRVSFSPDGKQFCFIRGVPQSTGDLLIVRDLEGGKERIVATIAGTENGQSWTPPAWSPDGRTIAVGQFRVAPRVHSVVTRYPAQGGRPGAVITLERYSINDLSWIPDGKAMVVTGTDLMRGFTPQVALLTRSGELRPVTNDMNSYFGASVSSGDEAIAVVRGSRVANIWVADASGDPPVAVTTFTNAENAVSALGVVDTGTLVFGAPQDRGAPIFSISPRGGEPRRLTEPDALCYDVLGYPGGVVIGRLDGNGVGHLWSMNSDGNGARQLTSGGGEVPVDVSSDGRSLTYRDDEGFLRSMSPRGGASRTYQAAGATRPARGGGDFSPDGSRMDFTSDVPIGGMQRTVVHIVPAGGGPEIAADTTPLHTTQGQWGPDAKTGTYLLNTDPANVYLRNLADRELRPLTHLTGGRIVGFSFSPDSRWLALVRDIGGVQNLWIADAAGGHATQVTHFTTGVVLGHHWLPDNRRIAVLAGPRSSDAVLIRQFR